MDNEKRNGFITPWLYSKFFTIITNDNTVIAINFRTYPFKPIKIKFNYINEYRDFRKDPNYFGVLRESKELFMEGTLQKNDLLLKKILYTSFKPLLDQLDINRSVTAKKFNLLFIYEIYEESDLDLVFDNLYPFKSLETVIGVVFKISLINFIRKEESFNIFNQFFGKNIYIENAEYFFQNEYRYPSWVKFSYNSYILEECSDIRELYMESSSPCVVFLNSLSNELQEISFNNREFLSLLSKRNGPVIFLDCFENYMETINPSLSPSIVNSNLNEEFYNQFLVHHHRGELTKDVLSNFCIYTGRAPTREGLHLGHYCSYSLAVELQKKYKAKVFFQLATFERGSNLTKEEIYISIQQVLAIGFNPTKTFFFVDNLSINSDYFKDLLDISQRITINRLTNTLGVDHKKSVTRLIYPLVQIVNCFYSAKVMDTRHTIVVCGLDQDPYFRIARDIARETRQTLPIILYNHQLPGYRHQEKMSSSHEQLLLTDSREAIERYVRSIPSKGGATLKEHRELGGDPNCKVLFLSYLIFLRERYEKIKSQYLAGTLLTNELREQIIFEINRIFENYQNTLRTLQTLKLKIL